MINNRHRQPVEINEFSRAWKYKQGLTFRLLFPSNRNCGRKKTPNHKKHGKSAIFQIFFLNLPQSLHIVICYHIFFHKNFNEIPEKHWFAQKILNAFFLSMFFSFVFISENFSNSLLLLINTFSTDFSVNNDFPNEYLYITLLSKFDCY